MDKREARVDRPLKISVVKVSIATPWPLAAPWPQQHGRGVLGSVGNPSEIFLSIISLNLGYPDHELNR